MKPLKNEAERLERARKWGIGHACNGFSKDPPTTLRTQLEREAFTLGYAEGIKQCEHDRDTERAAWEEAQRNPPPPKPLDGVKKEMYRLLDAVCPREISKLVGKAITGSGPEDASWGRSLIYGGEGQSEGVCFLLTEVEAQIAGDLILAINHERVAMRQKGREEGHNALQRLANGEMTVADYEYKRG